MKSVKEILTTGTGTEGQLLIPRKISDALFEAVKKTLLPRDIFALNLGPNDIPGSSYDLNKVDPNSMDVRLTAEGGPIILDNVTYTNQNIKPKKYSTRPEITTEMVEDSKFALLDQNVRTAGTLLAENENSLIVTALDDAGNTVSGSGAITIANITRAMQYLEDNDYTATDMIVGTEVVKDLRNIDTFVEAEKFGSPDMLRRGIVGTLFGMRVIRLSSNIMTNTTSYVFDRDHALVIAEKRPVTTKGYDDVKHDVSGVAITQRVAVEAIRTNAIANITT